MLILIFAHDVANFVFITVSSLAKRISPKGPLTALYLDVGHLQPALAVPGARGQGQAVAPSPADPGTKGSLVSTLEDYLATFTKKKTVKQKMGKTINIIHSFLKHLYKRLSSWSEPPTLLCTLN